MKTNKPPKEPIAHCRINANMTLDEAAERFGVSRRTIIRWERGEPRIPVDRLGEAEAIYKAERWAIRPDIFKGMAGVAQ